MTLKEMKKRVLELIEEINPTSKELTDDPDISAKINGVINHIQNELARIKKIPAIKEYEVKEENKVLNFKDIDENLYQLNIVTDVENKIIGDTIIFEHEGLANIYYYKYPTQITEGVNEDEFKFDLSTDVLEIMPYGVAGDLLKSDISAGYGNVYSNRYEQLKQQLDPRYHTGSIYIEGGIADEFL